MPGNSSSNAFATSDSLRVLACQIDVPKTTTARQRNQHIERTTRLVQGHLNKQSVDLVVMPELSSIDYSRESFEQLNELAEPDKGESFARWSRLAKTTECTVVYGFARKVQDGFSISSAAVAPDGELIGIYDKVHLAQFGDSMEKEYFNKRGQQLLVFEVGGFRIAPIICYDIRFPELCRELVLRHKVDVILHVGAYARDASFYSWHAFAMTRAIENQCFFLSLNRAGELFGQSVFCQPWVDQHQIPTVFDDCAEECRLLTLDRTQLIKARTEFTFLEDRLDNYELKTL